jgi:hypothetical protein
MKTDNELIKSNNKNFHFIIVFILSVGFIIFSISMLADNCNKKNAEAYYQTPVGSQAKKEIDNMSIGTIVIFKKSNVWKFHNAPGDIAIVQSKGGEEIRLLMNPCHPSGLIKVFLKYNMAEALADGSLALMSNQQQSKELAEKCYNGVNLPSM